MAQVKTHFLVDRKGLAKLMARRPKGYVILELLQNAWDEDGVTRVAVGMSYERGRAAVVVEDDAPEGFADLSHAYTLFAESRKVTNATKRGRFNIGEKLVIAICDNVEIATTKGTVNFDAAGRHHSRQRRETGTRFFATLRLRRREFDEMLTAAQQVIPPAGIVTTLNGEELQQREPLASFEEYLQTEIATADGYLRSAYRKAAVAVHEPRQGEAPTLYEMGIPVVAVDVPWHVDIGQKVPLNSDRDNVTPGYLHALRTHLLNNMVGHVSEDGASAGWVGDALESSLATDEAVRSIITKRFSGKCVITDPSDREAEKRAVAEGYVVIPARAFSASQWGQVRRAEAALPAGRVTPSPKPFSPDGEPLRTVPRSEWRPDVLKGAERLERLAAVITDGPVEIIIANDSGWRFGAACGGHRKLFINIARVGWSWFTKETRGQERLELLIHELSHIRVSDHLSEEYAAELCRLGARLAITMGEESGYD